MSNKHTPGPLQLHYDVADFSVTANDGKERVSYVGSEANAKLIAAAPDMLEALQSLVGIEAWIPDQELRKVFTEKVYPAIDKATK